MYERSTFWMPPLSLNSLFGIDGNGVFPSVLNPFYMLLFEAAHETHTPIHGKSFTYPPWNGNFHTWWPWTWKYIQRIRGDRTIVSPYEFWKFFGTRDKVGMLNAYGHTGPGIWTAIDKIGRSRRRGIEVIPSFFPDLSQNIDTLARQILDVLVGLKAELGEDFDKIELSLYCPNRQETENKDINASLKKSLMFLRIALLIANRFKVDIIAKVSVMHPYEFCQEMEHIGVKAIHAINAVPFSRVYNGGSISPLQRVGGGAVSGEDIRDISDRYFRGLRESVNLWLIKGGGVMHEEDVLQAFDMGADTVTGCTGPDLFPKEWREIIEEYNRYVA